MKRLAAWVAAAVIGAATHVAIVPTADACCAAAPSGKPVVNADQAVIIVWDAAKKTQHFIRRASFKSQADDFGFLVPTPTQPTLEEAGDAAFPHLQKLTEPEVIRQKAESDSGCSAGCSDKSARGAAQAQAPSVNVLEMKTVAGFDAVVLEASSSDALAGWLKEHGYAFSPEVEAWAKPYVDGGWKITALKVAKDAGKKVDPTVAAASLRISFQTDRPVFPYREPDSTKFAEQLGASQRLLRIYFLSDARYAGELTKDSPWTGRVAWAGKVGAEDRTKVAELLKLPADAMGPDGWFLTEFEDPWPYRVAPADVYFAKSDAQDDVRRPPIIQYTELPPNHGDVALGLLLVPLVALRLRRRGSPLTK